MSLALTDCFLLRGNEQTMITTWKKVVTLVACTVAVAFSGTVSAAMIGINLTGFRVTYVTSAGRLYDTQSEMGGSLNPAQAQLLTGSEFTVDNTLVAQFNQSMGENTYADLLLTNIAPDLVLPASVLNPSISEAVNGGTFGFEWFYDDNGTMRSLELVLDRTAVLLLRNPSDMNKPTLVISGSTSNWTQSNLPGGISFTPGTPISFSYTTTNTMPFDIVNPEGTFSSLFASGGVMELSGEGSVGVPEPAAWVLMLGMGSAVAALRYRLG
jgi:hypothetical protein